MRMTLSVESRNSVEVRLVGLGFNRSLKDWRRRLEGGCVFNNEEGTSACDIHPENQDSLAELQGQLYMSDAPLVFCFFRANLSLLQDFIEWST